MPSPAPTVEERIIHSQPSWVIASDQVELAVTKLGGHMAPVTFFRAGERPVQPYYISPWQDENVSVPVPVLAPLRGDFFCLPFGGNTKSFRGETHPPHGEACGGSWSLEGCVTRGKVVTLELGFETRARPGHIRRELSLVAGHNVVYSRTLVEGFAGPAPFSHHAILSVPERERALLCSCSPFWRGLTYPMDFGSPAAGEYQSLAPGATFRDLAKVQSIFRGRPPEDCTAFPTRPGFCDLVQTFERPAKRDASRPSWVTVVNTEEGWLWFAFKDPRQMPGRIFWMENRGRYNAPWNGRNACLGIEDGCMYFDLGLVESCGTNPVSRLGVKTCAEFGGETPVDIRYVQGVARVPRNFGRVRDLVFGKRSVVFHSANGRRVKVPVAHEFLSFEEL